MKQLFKLQNKLPLYIFLLFLFFLPQQFGPHFWPIFSYVRGIRIDYLSPSLYVSDILLLILLIVTFKQVFLNKQVLSFFKSRLFILFLLILCIPFLYSHSPANMFFFFFLFFKFLFIGLFAATQIKKKDLIPISFVFLLGGFLESILSIFQFYNQQSIGGLFYFFGERTIFLSSIGAAVINTKDGLILRPYGTFSHPNILAFYLLISFIFGRYFLRNVQGIIKLFTILVIVVIQTTILLSFSRTVIFLDLTILVSIGLLTRNVKNFRKQMVLPALLLLAITSFLIFFSNRVSNWDSITSAVIPRLDLLKINFEILQNNFLFGVGVSNYLFSQVEFQKSFSQIYLQPVHNIYLLIAVQTGITGFVVILLFLFKTLKKIILKMKNSSASSFPIIYLLFSLLFVGIFDHYLLTIAQGQILTALILGLSWSKKY